MSVAKFTVIHQTADVIFQSGQCYRRIEMAINQREAELCVLGGAKIHRFRTYTKITWSHFRTNISVGYEQEGQWFNLHIARLNLPHSRILIITEKMAC